MRLSSLFAFNPGLASHSIAFVASLSWHCTSQQFSKMDKKKHHETGERTSNPDVSEFEKGVQVQLQGKTALNDPQVFPKPTTDPLDPLNWSGFRKHTILGIVMLKYVNLNIEWNRSKHIRLSILTDHIDIFSLHTSQQLLFHLSPKFSTSMELPTLKRIGPLLCQPWGYHLGHWSGHPSGRSMDVDWSFCPGHS